MHLPPSVTTKNISNIANVPWRGRGGGGQCAESPRLRPTAAARAPSVTCCRGHRCYLYSKTIYTRTKADSGPQGQERLLKAALTEARVCPAGALLMSPLGLHLEMDLTTKTVHKTAGGSFGLQNEARFAGAGHANCRCSVLITNGYELFLPARESGSSSQPLLLPV